MEEVLEGLRIRQGGVYLDGTLGGGGHALEILKGCAGTTVIGLDRDPAALELARRKLEPFKNRIMLFHINYRNMDSIFDKAGIEQVDGILLDLGVSSLQLEAPARGFAFSKNGPLDMRMDPEDEITAADIVNTWSRDDLKRAIYRYGEERLAGPVAKAIVREREKDPIETTERLAGIVRGVPGMGRVRNIDPATRTFQAIRIVVNDELGALEETLPLGIKRLNEGGRMAVISFHSLEDRTVKRAFREMADPCLCPREAPLCTCGMKTEGVVVTRKPIKAGSEEISRNPRSRSAKLRIFERGRLT
jgi:16S rRNA (cytosine1402-N4)-methyltransferase